MRACALPGPNQFAHTHKVPNSGSWLPRSSDSVSESASTMAPVWAHLARGKLSGAGRYALAVLGVSAAATFGLLLSTPEMAAQLQAGLAFASASQTSGANGEGETGETPAAMDGPAPAFGAQSGAQTGPQAGPRPATQMVAGVRTRQQEWVTTWLSKRYRVAQHAADLFVATTYLTAKEVKLDPLLILAVMAIESGLNPFAESPMGAQGLMQVMSKVHHRRFKELGGMHEALNPVSNIRVGAAILKDYVTRGGSLEAGLKGYVGAGAFESDDGYGSRVLAEYQRLKDVAIGKQVPVNASTPATPKQTTAQAGSEQEPATVRNTALEPVPQGEHSVSM